MVGVIIVVDQLVRWSGLEAFTTDQGLLDRETAMAALRADYGSTADVVWSLNYLSGDLWFQQLLSIVLMVAAVCLSLGLSLGVPLGLSLGLSLEFSLGSSKRNSRVII